MKGKINAKQLNELKISVGKVKKIFQTEATNSGNGAIIYVPVKYIKDKFFVVICE